MDCGFSNHVGDGVNWCSPYKSWQTVYDNDLHQILESHGGTIEDRKRITGAEVALWTETVSVSKSTFQKYILFEFKRANCNPYRKTFLYHKVVSVDDAVTDFRSPLMKMHQRTFL